MKFLALVLLVTACAAESEQRATTATLAAGPDVGAVDAGAAQPDAKVACPTAECDCCGRCSKVQGECIPQTDSDCAGSQLCSSSGLCHFVQDGTCGPIG